MDRSERRFVTLSMFAVTALAHERDLRAEPSSATTSSSVALPVHVDVGEGCPALPIEHALAERVRRSVAFTAAARTTVIVRFAVASEEGTTAELSFEGISGEDRRTIRGASCEDVAAALSIVAATWVESEPSPEDEGPERGRERPSPPERAVMPVPPVVADSATARRAEARRSPDLSGAAASSPFWLGAHVASNPGIVSGLLPALQLTGALRVRERFELRVGLRGARAEDEQARGKASLLWGTLPIDGCMGFRLGHAFEFSPCARFEPGVVGIDYDRVTRTLPWIGAGPGARIAWSAAPIRLELEAFAPVQVLGWDIRADRATLEPFRSVTASLGAGVMMSIP
jgi:hypothetical protein